MTTLVAPPTSAKTTLCLSFALVFLTGGVSGALLMKARTHGHSIQEQRGHFDYKFEMQHLRKELDLNDEQARQLSMILDDVAKYYDNVLSDGQTRVMQILDENQRAKFRKLLADDSH